MFGMPSDASTLYLNDDSGILSTPYLHSKVNPSHRVKCLTHFSITKFLTGSGLKPFAENFAVNLAEQLEASNEIFTEWNDLPDLYTFMRDENFEATTRAVYRENFFHLTAPFAKIFGSSTKAYRLLQSTSHVG